MPIASPDTDNHSLVTSAKKISCHDQNSETSQLDVLVYVMPEVDRTLSLVRW